LDLVSPREVSSIETDEGMATQVLLYCAAG
jgi:hypothetical protein